MEKSLGILNEHFPLTENELRTYSALSFAYIGDSIYDVIIRTMVVTKGNTRPNKYHKDVIKLVNANAQTQIMGKIKDVLTEDELAVFRRGRNAKTSSVAKNQSNHDYRIATGFEALIGYLYLSGKMERILELIEIGLGEDSACPNT
ncbi:MAG: ribonuclease III domain-containing protein [Eubacteriales bacterium]|nr:ribonuclease III domain-containing protein [Eubacteriales bacterium]